MLSVDTNVVVRLLVNDDAQQGERARRIFDSDQVWIGVTVLLESAWVLESAYGLSTAESARVLRGLLGLPNVQVEDATSIARALDATRTGVDLADALHLLRAPEESEFITFDRALAKAGKKLRPTRLA